MITGTELLEALPVAVYTTDAEGRITFYNRAAAELWGHHPELGSSQWCGSWRLYWPDGRPMPHDECPMAIALREGRELRGVEAIAERPDGSRVAFTPYPTVLRDPDGTVVGAVNVLVDITDRARVEDSLRATAEALRASNAVKYSPPEAPIEVVVRATEAEAQVLVLDEGIGLAGTDMGQLFSAFYRSDAARNQSAGLGIGLAACKRVVESLGGRVWAHPRKSGGSEFGFALPLA